MFQLTKRPKTSDINYLEDIFTLLYNIYGKVCFPKSRINISFNLSGFEDIKSICLQLLFELKISSVIFKENEEQYFEESSFNELPPTYNFLTENGSLIISITQFGTNNPQITITEIILFLASYKFNKDGYAVPDEIFDDMEQSYRPFLVCLSIFYGYGEILLERNWISGSFHSKDKQHILRYKYYVPLEINTLIYAFSFCLYFSYNHLPSNNYIKVDLSHINKNIRKEIQVCYNHFKKGKSDFMNWILLNHKDL